MNFSILENFPTLQYNEMFRSLYLTHLS